MRESKQGEKWSEQFLIKSAKRDLKWKWSHQPETT